MVFRRRALRTAAVVGGTAYVAGKAGAKAGAANAPAASKRHRLRSRLLPRRHLSPSSASHPRASRRGIGG